MTSSDFQRIGVLGAGTMGSGIALTALFAGLEVMLVEVSPEVRQRARQYIASHLERKAQSAALDRLSLGEQLGDLAGCQVVIEAVPEDLDLKQSLFAELDQLCPPPAILATNTSTLRVTAIAAATASPERVAGLHFFNPAPVMQLVEVAAGAATDSTTMQRLVGLAKLLGKTPVTTRGTPGFVVNRVARPYYAEALRLLGEGVAEPSQIDTLARLGAGFKMGPFELMDLIGLDVNYAATKSMYEASFGEPRYRPHPIQQEMVLRGWLGRKTDRGFHTYESGTPIWQVPEAPEAQPASGYLLLSDGSWAPGVRKLLAKAGYSMSETHGDLPALAMIALGREEGAIPAVRQYDQRLSPAVPLLCQMADIGWTELASDLANHQRLIGFEGLFFAGGSAVTLVKHSSTSGEIRSQVENWVRGLGKIPLWIEESPGLILPRIIACLINEAFFALLEGLASSEAIDQAMLLGVNYPLGPFAWAERLGHDKVLAVLDHLRKEFGEERYRASPLLRRRTRHSPEN